MASKTVPALTTRPRRKRAKKSATTNRQLDALWRKLMKLPALLPEGAGMEAERTHVHSLGMSRRVMLRSAEKSFAELHEIAMRDRDSAELVAAMRVFAEVWLDHLKASLELADAQVLRLRCALAEREDMHEIVAKARAEIVPQSAQNVQTQGA